MLDPINQKDKETKKHKITYGLIFFVALVTLIISVLPNNYIQPDQQFLNSIVHFGERGEYGDVQVYNFVKLLEQTDLDLIKQGGSLKVIGWTKEDDKYTLHIKLKEPNYSPGLYKVVEIPDVFEFSYNGEYSVMERIKSRPMFSPELLFQRLISGSETRYKIQKETNIALIDNIIPVSPQIGICIAQLSRAYEYPSMRSESTMTIEQEQKAIISGYSPNNVWFELKDTDSEKRLYVLKENFEILSDY